MADAKPRNLPWLDRLNAKLPDYGGYQQQHRRGDADQVFRDAIAARLDEAERNVQAAIRECIAHQAEREVGALELIQAEVHRLADRVRRAVSPSMFLDAGEFGESKADALHALDHALFERATALVTSTSRTTPGHDWLSGLKAELDAFQAKLDARAMLFQSLS